MTKIIFNAYFCFAVVILISINKLKAIDSLCRIEIFITPKNPRLIAGDNGVYNYNLSKQNIYVGRQSAYYCTISEFDSVHLQVYKNYTISNAVFNKLFDTSNLLSDTTSSMRRTRILMICSYQNNSDTLLFDNELSVYYRNTKYKPNSIVSEYIYRQMPLEFKENWIFCN